MAKKKSLGVVEVADAHEDAFLRAILETPKDDTPRLVYADYLTEKGNPFGEFVRCQVESRGKDRPAADKRKNKKRADELLHAHRKEWMGELPYDPEKTKIERGFVESFDFVGYDEFDQEVLARLAAQPIFALSALMAMRYTYDPSYLRHLSILVRLPRLGCMGKLDWSGAMLGSVPGGDDDDEEEGTPEGPLGILLLGSPHLAGLRELRLANCKLKDGAVKALAKNPAAASLRALDLGSDGSMEVAGNLFRLPGLKALCESPHLDGLEELDLSDAWLGDKEIDVLVKATHLKGLKKLDLDGIGMTDKGARVLANSPFLERLEELVLANGQYQSDTMGEATARAFAASPHADKLKKLDLRLYDLPEDAVAALRSRFGKRVKLGDD